MTHRLIEMLEQRQFLAADNPFASAAEEESGTVLMMSGTAGIAVGAQIEVRIKGKVVEEGTIFDVRNGRDIVITVKNTGTSPLQLATPNLSNSADFFINDGLTVQLDPGESDTFGIQFGNSSFGVYSTLITIGTNIDVGDAFTFRLRNTYAPGTGTGQIKGVVYNDANGNARRNRGENGLAGRRVYVDIDDDGRRHELEPMARTDANGNYVIKNVPPGAHRVRVHFVKKWRTSTPTAGFQMVNAQNGKTAVKINFGQTQRSGVAGSVIRDLDGDGLRDPGEAGLRKFRVYVDLDNDKVWDKNEPSAQTNSSGIFYIKSVPPGTHTVRVHDKAGFKHTTKPKKVKLAKASVKVNVLFGERPIVAA